MLPHAGNVLLNSAPGVAHSFAAKVADFGLARTLSIVSRLEARPYGTMTHMAPEALASDTLSKASDVYSFGVILWELYTGQRAWAGLNFAQVGAQACSVLSTEVQAVQHVLDLGLCLRR